MYELLEEVEMFIEEYALLTALSVAGVVITIVYHLTH